VQEALWAELAGTGLQAYLAEPGLGSIHSFGMAVDVELLDARGHACDMGSGFDELCPRSHPALEARLLAAGELTAAQVAHRECLRAAMAAGGFDGIAIEWWHFDLGDREAVRRAGPRVL
jgi:D-alanyl-D-alanine dipeptidase